MNLLEGLARPPIMLARYDRYILGRLMVTFGFFTLIIVLIYWINRSIRLFDRLIGDGQSLALFAQLSLLSLPYLIYLMLPLSAFAASVSTGNRMGSDSETVALQAAGISAFRIVRPAFYLGLMAAALMLLLAHLLVPLARVTVVDLEDRLADAVGARLLEPGKFQSPVEGVTVFVSEITDEGVLSKVLLSDQRDEATEVLYTANQALLLQAETGPQLVMISGLAQSLRADGTLSILHFEDFALSLGTARMPEERVLRDLRGWDTLSLLRAEPETLELVRKSKAEFLHEAHRRFATPALAVCTAVLGFAALLVGGFSRFGFWQQVAGAIVLIVAIQLFANFAEDLALQSDEAWPILYAPVVFAATAVGMLLYLADHPLKRRRRDPAEGAT
ncbi:LptF/LptG family permease [Dinoroseobacter sp. S124A]|uniref:LptF/LptG family permease n=1 Tax=Dinoroseobacter sp. S124A TaxID=3415128 RepID=UPI003C7BEFD3